MLNETFKRIFKKTFKRTFKSLIVLFVCLISLGMGLMNSNRVEASNNPNELQYLMGTNYGAMMTMPSYMESVVEPVELDYLTLGYNLPIVLKLNETGIAAYKETSGDNDYDYILYKLSLRWNPNSGEIYKGFFNVKAKLKNGEVIDLPNENDDRIVNMTESRNSKFWRDLYQASGDMYQRFRKR